MKPMNGKRILLIAPRFFGYEEDIAAEFRRRGAEVDFLPDRPFQSSFMKAVTRLKRELILAHADRFFENALKNFGRQKYELILVIQGEGVSPNFLYSLRKSYLNTPFVLYMWDSFRNKKSLIPNISYFDKCLTFDIADSKRYDMKFRPLFFSRGFERSSCQNFEYDISFIGTAHSDRYRIVSQIAVGLPTSARSYWYLFLQAHWVFYAHKIGNPAFKSARMEDFHYTSLPKSEVQRIFLGSRAVLDIEHPAQTGLTMRTFETLGTRKKLITTNKSVREYDFFNPQNILVIDRNKIAMIPHSFLAEPYIPLSDDLYAKYSLSGWIDEVIDLA